MPEPAWNNYQRFCCSPAGLGLTVDVSRMGLTDEFLTRMDSPMREAFGEMAELEAGAIANPTEQRQVGHYWLRTPHISPSDPIRRAIESTVADIRAFAAAVHVGSLGTESGQPFRHVIIAGIGGSALGPQLLADALGSVDDRMTIAFCDNTDPNGIDRILDPLSSELDATLIVVTSKSGGTRETHNAMLEIRRRFEIVGLEFSKHAVAITCEGSRLDQLARAQGWVRRFPIWDWVGGRTSVTSAVGLLPAALLGIDVDAFLAGASACDAVTRVQEIAINPAAWLALAWFHAGNGRGDRAMVVLPYKDRLLLFGRYVQQLVMESLGKRLDRAANVVNQGLNVYGNKGSTDQHAYVQQLRDGRDDFFATFIQVLAHAAPAANDRPHPQGAASAIDIRRTTATPNPADETAGSAIGDDLQGFLLGTRQALSDAGRPSITITLDDLSPRTLGVLIALFERAVGYYASLIDVNAYDQPGVEAGKQAADAVLALQRKLLDTMHYHDRSARTASDWAAKMNEIEQAETVFHILRYLAADPSRGVKAIPGDDLFDTRYLRSD